MADLTEQFPTMTIKAHDRLDQYTYTKTGGAADWVAFPKSVAEVQQLVQAAREQAIPVTVLGNASNLIVKEGGIAGLVLILTAMNEISVHDQVVTAQAGASYIETTKVARDHSLTGLEFAAGIPGSIGGAVFMNAGAYGGETKDVIANVTVLMPDGAIKTLTHDELAFGYRYSKVQDLDAIVLAADFALQSGDQAAITAMMDDLNQRRADKQPLELPSCGSVFKRPVGHFAGKLIHDAGLQGYTVGGAQVSQKHAGFIVNVGGATASDYLAVIHHVQAEVKRQFDVDLETEVRIIGRD